MVDDPRPGGVEADTAIVGPKDATILAIVLEGGDGQSKMGDINNLKKKGENMAFWKQISKSGIFKITSDTGTHFKNIVLGGQTLLDQTKDVVRTIDKRNKIRHYDTETGKQLK